MFVRCIGTSAGAFSSDIRLTIGRVYEVLGEDFIHYKIEDNSGRIQAYYKTRFVVVNEEGQEKSAIEIKIRDIKSRRERLGYRW